jgi:hypothetical protein
MRTIFAILLSSALAGTVPPAWVARSNEHAKIALEPVARFRPEAAASVGMEGVDEQIQDFKPRVHERRIEATRIALAELRKRRTAEQDPLVRQDLEILVRALELDIRSAEVGFKSRIPYVSPAQFVYRAMTGLLDPQIAEKRRPAAAVRLRRYAGLEEGYTPATVLIEQRIRERLMVPGITVPPREELEKDLKNSATFVDAIGPLFK